MDGLNIPELVDRLASDEDPVRKMAVFKLQSNIGDPSFAEMFIQEGGVSRLKYLVLHSSGNTLAYSLTSYSKLLGVDKGWESVEEGLVERIVELIVTHPLVNILRGAMSILVSIVAHTHTSDAEKQHFGLKGLQPALRLYPQFLDMLVSRLSSGDHALCGNSLQLINCLTRDAIMTDAEAEWPDLLKRVQDLGVIEAVYTLMQGSAVHDLAQPLLEFQTLSKVLLRRWREVPVEIENAEHRRILKSLNSASFPKGTKPASAKTSSDDLPKQHNPMKWRRLGFSSEQPHLDFEAVGFLGMIDFMDYVRNCTDEFQRLLLEQASHSPSGCCPIAKASLAITGILYDFYEVDKADVHDARGGYLFEPRMDLENHFTPLVLHWQRLHVAGLHAFLRLWRVTEAEQEDFSRITDLVRILYETVLGGATRTTDIKEIEESMAAYEYPRLRQLQTQLLELSYEDTWSEHLQQVKADLNSEAVQFVKEQRIRCLLQGAWFVNDEIRESTATSRQNQGSTGAKPYRYVQLSHNRRFLHHGEFGVMDTQKPPTIESLPTKIDLHSVTSVVSNTKAPKDRSSEATIKTTPHGASTDMRITIYGNPSPTSLRRHSVRTTETRETQDEMVMLTLYPDSHSVASEWLDGLLMLLGQEPITSDTKRLTKLVTDYGLKIRLLNVRFDDANHGSEPPPVPGREGVDNDYYYDIFGAA